VPQCDPADRSKAGRSRAGRVLVLAIRRRAAEQGKLPEVPSFVRVVTFALIASLAGLSFSRALCVVGCAGHGASRAQLAQTCHEQRADAIVTTPSDGCPDALATSFDSGEVTRAVRLYDSLLPPSLFRAALDSVARVTPLPRLDASSVDGHGPAPILRI
jgi:hypothetical protein